MDPVTRLLLVVLLIVLLVAGLGRLPESWCWADPQVCAAD